MRFSTICGLSFGMFLFSTGLNQWEAKAKSDDSSERRFRHEYPTAVAKLQERFQHVKGNGRLVVERGLPGKPGSTQTEKIEFFFDAKYLKVIILKEGDTLTEGKSTASKRAALKVACATPAYSFTVDRQTVSSPPQLNNFASGSGGPMEESILAMKQQRVDAPFVALAPLTELLTSPLNKINVVSSITKYGHECIKVEYDHEIRSSKGSVTLRSYVILDPALGWALREFEADSGKAKSTTTVEYVDDNSKAPIPKRIELTSYGSRSIFDLERFEFGSTPLSEFTLGAAGVGEIAKRGNTASRSQVPYWLIGGGILAGVVAAGLTYGARRQKQRS